MFKSEDRWAFSQNVHSPCICHACELPFFHSQLSETFGKRRPSPSPAWSSSRAWEFSALFHSAFLICSPFPLSLHLLFSSWFQPKYLDVTLNCTSQFYFHTLSNNLQLDQNFCKMQTCFHVLTAVYCHNC